MSIMLGIPCLNRFDWLEKCIMSASQGSIAPDRFVVVDNSCGAIARDGMRLSDIFGSDVEVITPAYNLGVAASWNRIVQACGPDDQLIISNDDILFAKDTIERLLGAAEQAPGAGTVSAIDGQKFSLFYLRRRCYDAVGPFDEAFYPGYFEDNDFKERAERAGWQLISAVSNVEHGGSQTRQAMDEQALARSHQQFKKNAIYFVAKWGNLPHEGPLYEAPFDL